MAHMQKRPDHTHESESKKNFKLVDINAVAGVGSHGRPHSEVKHVNAAKLVAAGLEKPTGPEIAGFPWQFVAVMAVIVLGLLTLIIRSVFGW